MAPMQLVVVTLLCLTAFLVAIITTTDLPSKEQFEEIFSIDPTLTKIFHTMPGLAVLFTQNANLTWTAIVPACICQLLSYDLAQVMPPCYDALNKIDSTYATIRIVTRCFKSDNPYDYDLFVEPIERIIPNEGSPLGDYQLHFAPPKCCAETCHCRLRTVLDMDADVLVSHLNEGTEKGFYLPPAEGIKLSKVEYEEAFLDKDAFNSKKYITTVFQRMSAKLEPLVHCEITLLENGLGLVPKNCWDILKVYRGFNETLPNIVLPIRCYHKDNTEYDLHLLSISNVTEAEDGRRLITFPPTESSTCSPIWANEVNASISWEDPETVHRQYLESLTKESFEEALAEYDLKPEMNTWPSLGFIFGPGSFSTEKILIPADFCFAFLIRYGIAIIPAQCASTLQMLEKLYKPLAEQANLLLAYKCYLKDNSGAYELHTATIQMLDNVGEKSATIYFKPQEADHCRVVWLGNEIITDDVVHEEL